MTRSRSLPKLKFNKGIVPSVEESIPTKELINRLKDLSNELTKVDQDNIDVGSLDVIKNQLASKRLIKNNNLVVQSYVACCLSDILRIYAPDAPFTAGELSDIFKLFFNQFKHLNEQDTNGCFPQYYYLLSKLSEVRSIILITDLPDSQKLIENIFETFYNLANQPNFPMKLEPLICDILSEVISESDAIPTKVLKLILNKFLNDKSIANSVNPSLNFTLSICNTNTDRISRLITQFFSEMIYEGSQNDQASEKFIDDLKKLHKLCYQVWKYIPELLASVMGLIEDELDAENVTIRLSATEAVSKIISIYPAKLNFTQTHSDTYTSWLKKTLDVSSTVRCKWVETTLPILLSKKQDIQDIVNGLTKCLLDSDERVRFITCKTLAELPSKLFLEKIASQTIMNTLSQLIREKHTETRNEIIRLLGNLYNDCWEEEKNNKLLSWIPEHIFNLIYINDRNINSVVDLCVIEKLLPFESDAEKRVDRLLFMLSALSDKAKASFHAILKRQQQLSKVLLEFLKNCELYNGGLPIENNSESALREKLDKIIDWLAVGLPSFYSSRVCLDRFVKLNNRRFYKLIKLCLSADSDYETIKASMKELFNKVNDPKSIKLENDIAIPTSDMLNVFKLLMYRSSLVIVNKSNVPIITAITKDPSNSLCPVAREMLETISTNVPGVFKSHIHELTAFVSNYHEQETKGKYAQTLNTILQFLKQYPEFNEQLPIDFYDTLFKIAKHGSVLESRFSVKIICLCRHKYSYTEDLFNECYPLDVNHKDFVTHLSVIAELYLDGLAPLEEKSADITAFLIKELLLVNPETESNESETWIEDEDFEKGDFLNCQQKLLALRIFSNRLIQIGSSSDSPDESKITSLCEPVFKLFMTLIGNGGEIVKTGNPTPKNCQSKLRLSAGLMMLRISQVSCYNKLMTPVMINRLVFLVQDECKEVRQGFVEKLQKSLVENAISERFLPLLFFAAHEPDESLKSNVETWLRSSFTKKSTGETKDVLYERSFVRLLHMISHHQEYTDLMNDYAENKSEDSAIQAYCFALEYICFYLGLFATQENISLLYYFASRVKQYRDQLIPAAEYDEVYKEENTTIATKAFNIYRVAELAQMAIKDLAHCKNWILSTYPRAFKLSSDLFVMIKSQDEAQHVAQTMYTEDTGLAKLQPMVRAKVSTLGTHTVKRSLKENSNAQNKKVRAAVVKQKTTKPTVQKRPVSAKQAYTGPVRKSSRTASKNVKYAQGDGSEDEDEEMEYNDENEVDYQF